MSANIVSKSIHRLFTGADTTSPLGGVTPTTTVDEQGGGDPDGAQAPMPGGVTLAVLLISAGGFASSTAVTV